MQDSVWFRTLGEEELSLLGESDPLPQAAEVVIVGAGMIGLATAYYLSVKGISNICVLDRGTAAGEASGANAGGLWFGQASPEMGPLVPLAHASSRLYDKLAASPGFNFDLRRTGLLELLYSEADWQHAYSLVRSVRQAGFLAEEIERGQLHRLEPALGIRPAGAVFYPDEAQINPVKLGAALVRHLRNREVKFCLDAEVLRLEPRVATSGGDVDAGTTVIASGSWTPLVTRVLGYTPPIKPMRGQLLATEPRPPLVHHTVLGRDFYHWQLAEGYMAGGGTVEDVGFERGVNPADLARIRSEMDELFPALRGLPTACAWSGFRPCCEDLKPVIGKVPGQERVYVAAGHYKKGIMLAPVTGKILADLITKGKTDLPIEALDPARFGQERP
ncbi:MAG: FAD-binding oxidoreductase [Acidobacteria bacterium]|nr:FAD-binding oxidoreductase [Acidobacteriota bacterium]